MISVARFVEQLGWPAVRRCSHQLPSDARGPAKTIVWYESGDQDSLLLQINTLATWHAAVFAIRYRLFSGWYHVPALPTERLSDRQLALATGRFHYSHFATLDGRRQYRIIHPETTGFSWRKIRATPQMIRT